MDEQFLWIATGLFPKVTQLVMVRAWFESQNLGLQLPGSYLVSQSVKNLPAMGRDLGSIPRSARSPGEWNGCPFQFYCLENPIDR